MSNENSILSSRAKKALEFSFDIHSEQTRKSRGGKIPYFSHVSTVANMVLELNGTEDEYIAALLHDSVEDQAQKVAKESIGSNQSDSVQEKAFTALGLMFGDNVKNIIEQLTDPKLPKEFKKLPRDQRIPFIKEQRVKKFEKLRSANDSVRKIKACDALHNLRSLYQDYTETGPDVFKNFAADQEGTIWYYEELAKIFGELGPRRAAIEMSQMINRLKNLISADEGKNL